MIPEMEVPDVLGDPMKGKMILEYCKCCKNAPALPDSDFCYDCHKYHRWELEALDAYVPMPPKKTMRWKMVPVEEDEK